MRDWKPTHRHYKGGLYRVIAHGKMEADLSPVVVYEGADGGIWVRPADNFDGEASPGVKRFTPIEEHRIWHVVNADDTTSEETEKSLRDRVVRGSINQDTWVWRPGMAEWEPAEQVLQHLFALPSAPPASSRASSLRQMDHGDRELRQSRRITSLGSKNATTTIWRFLFSFKGRINRARYWLGALLFPILVIVLAIIYYAATRWMGAAAVSQNSFEALATPGDGLGEIGIFAFALLISFFMGWVSLALGVKRLHDRDKSGWWLLFFYVLPSLLTTPLRASDSFSPGFPLAFTIGLGVAGFLIGIWAFVELACLRGTVGPNRFGPDPLASNHDGNMAAFNAAPKSALPGSARSREKRASSGK